MDRLQNIETFVRVAQTQSFAEAARQLRVAKSVVTTRIKQLEDYLGGPLFHRSTRVVRLSELGQAFLRDCTELVGRANDIVDQMRDVRGKPAGTLRVHALTGFVLGHFGALLREWQPDLLVVGLPRHPDGTPHAMTQLATRFGNQLNGRFNLPVAWVDERYSSVDAEARLRERGDDRSQLDAEAACVILQQYLDERAAPQQ